MIRNTPLIAFDGTHSSGKTTLIYAVAAELKAKGINCVILPEPARISPLVEDVVLHDIGSFDIPLETELFALHLLQCVQACRVGKFVISDRTPANVMAYTHLLVNSLDKKEREFFAAMENATSQWLKFYDLIFYCCDHFNINLDEDRLRSKVVGIQDSVDEMTRLEYKKANIQPIDIPCGLQLKERVDFVLSNLKNLLIH